jgi:hypothetical protein
MDFAQLIRINLPDLCTVKHLIEFGVFSSEQSAHNARKNQKGPPYFKINRNILYPKEALIEYLEKNYYSCGN